MCANINCIWYVYINGLLNHEFSSLIINVILYHFVLLLFAYDRSEVMISSKCFGYLIPLCIHKKGHNKSCMHADCYNNLSLMCEYACVCTHVHPI